MVDWSEKGLKQETPVQSEWFSYRGRFIFWGLGIHFGGSTWKFSKWIHWIWGILSKKCGTLSHGTILEKNRTFAFRKIRECFNSSIISMKIGFPPPKWPQKRRTWVFSRWILRSPNFSHHFSEFSESPKWCPCSRQSWPRGNVSEELWGYLPWSEMEKELQLGEEAMQKMGIVKGWK